MIDDTESGSLPMIGYPVGTEGYSDRETFQRQSCEDLSFDV